MYYLYLIASILFVIIVHTGYRKYQRGILCVPREPADRKALLIRLFPAVRDYYRDPNWGKARQAHTRPEVLESNTTLFKSIYPVDSFSGYVCSIRYNMVENADYYVFISPETHFSILMTPKRKFKFVPPTKQLT